MKESFPGSSVWRVLFALTVILVALVNGRCEEPEAPSGFDAANLLYEKGQFEKAARAYEKIVGEGVRSSALLFNTGNAWFKSGQTGRAVAYWLQAQSIDPRNDRIKINLEFARKQISGGALPVELWPAPLRLLNLDEWALLLLAMSWLCFGSLTLMTWKPKLETYFRLPAACGGLLLVATLVLFSITTRDRARTVTAVVLAEEAVVRFGPLAESQSAFVARSGSEFRVTDRKDAWLKVEDAMGREGWLLSNQVIQLRAGRVFEEPTNAPATASGPTHIALANQIRG